MLWRTKNLVLQQFKVYKNELLILSKISVIM